MTAPVNTTSQIYNAWRAFTRILGEVDYPANPANPDGVKVWFGDPDQHSVDQAPSKERAVVVPMVVDPSQSWGPVGQHARDEVFACLIVITTAVEGFTAAQVRDRLEQISAAVESKLRDTVKAGEHPVEIDSNVWQWGVGYVRPFVGPGDGGHQVGRCEITVDCSARI